MRVLLDVSAVPAQPVGAGIYTLRLASGLDRRDDIDLHLLTRRGDLERWRHLAPRAAIHAEAPARRPARLVWEQLGGPRLAARVGADVWHGPHYTLPLHANVPTVVTVHDLTFFDHPEWHERTKVTFFRRMLRVAAERADVLVCISEFTAERLRACLAPRGDVVVVHHGVDHDRFRPDGDVAADLAPLAAHGIRPPFVAFAGTVEPRKGIPTLVHAFARIARGHPDLRLVLAGNDGWGAQATRDAISASGVATRVLRPGYLDDTTLAALFRRAEAVVYPSLEEGFGLPALEALACGTPVVTTKGSALEEVAGDAALLVPPGDVDTLAAALGSVLDDHTVARRLRGAGPERAARFTWTRCIEGHVEAYALAVG